MQKEDCFNLGHISRQHGYKGEVVAVFDTDIPQKYKELESVFLEEDGELIPFFIDQMATNSKGHFIIQFEDVEGEEEARRLVNKEIFLPLEFLPPLSGKSFYYHEVEGFQMIDTEHGTLGECLNVIDQSSQPIFRISDGETEYLVPAVDDFIEEIDRNKRTIVLNTPPGLIQLYRDA